MALLIFCTVGVTERRSVTPTKVEIIYDLPSDNFVRIKIYDILGKEVITLTHEYKTAVRQTVRFDASNLPSGIYYYRIDAGLQSGVKEFTAVRKMMLIK